MKNECRSEYQALKHSVVCLLISLAYCGVFVLYIPSVFSTYELMSFVSEKKNEIAWRNDNKSEKYLSLELMFLSFAVSIIFSFKL